MSCPTCDHTLALLTQDDTHKVRYFLCGRCGTVKMTEEGLDGQPIEQVFVPKLVERCREYEKSLIECGTPSPAYLGKDWQRLGIAESINKPEDRRGG